MNMLTPVYAKCRNMLTSVPIYNNTNNTNNTNNVNIDKSSLLINICIQNKYICIQKNIYMQI